MSPDLTSRVRVLFERAAAMEPGARGVLLDSMVATDPDAAAEVRSLLEHHDRTGVILDRTPLELAAMLSPAPAPTADEAVPLPATLGSYTLERSLGSGGMGVVYRARQAFPNRPVAIKLIRPEALSGAALRRFENEAEALGLLDHPGIARVFEAGRATLNGQPRAYIAMELVEGEPLTQFADRTSLPARDRIDLLARVCDAVQFAHRRGVIHRDLKPANILVPADGRPRVVDFGVARILGPDRAATLTTAAGQIVGTLAYMSPEQARGDAAATDTRADVYSLGAVLFELLCGRTPIDISTLSVHGALAAIQTVEPRVPSEFRSRLGRDLEAVLLKALEKDPTRRYQHASELGDDLRRFLGGESVSARIPSALTQLARFCRRNKQLTAAAAIVAVTLGAAVAVSGAAYARERAALKGERAAHTDAKRHAADAERSRDEALVNLKRYQAVSQFTTTLLGGVKAEVARGQDTALLRSLLETAESALEELDKLPAAGGDAHVLLADVFRDLGEFDRSEEHLKDAIALYTEAFGEADRNTASAMHNLGALYRGSMRRLGEAEPLLRRATEIFERTGGPDDPELAKAQNSLALLYLDQGDYFKAEPMLAAMRAREERADRWSAHALRLGHNHAGALAMVGRPHAAAALAKTTYEARRDTLGPDQPETISTMLFYGRVLASIDRPREALPLIEEGLEQRTRVYGADHQLTISARGYHADVLRALGRLDEALAETRVAAKAAMESPALGPMHNDTLQTRLQLLDLELLADAPGDHLAEADAIVAAYRKKGPAAAFWVDYAQSKRGMALAVAGRTEEAEATLTAAYSALAGRIGAGNNTSRRVAENLAWFYERTGRPDDAAAWRAKAAPPPD